MEPGQIRRRNRKMIRDMLIDDYPQIIKLWRSISGFRIRSIDDSEEGIRRFLARNPGISKVVFVEGKIAGSVLCGHDGRTGTLYHVCIADDFRRRGLGEAMIEAVLESLKKEHIHTVNLIAFTENTGGNIFWQTIGWKKRDDVNYYEKVIDSMNTIEIC